MSASSSHTPLLRFVFAQSYAKAIGDTSQPAPAVRVPGLADDAASIPLDWHAAGALGGLAYPPVAPAPAPAPVSARWWHALAALLYGTFGVQRLEPANVYNPHRGYPSARGRFPLHAYLVHEHGALYYDPVGHGLRPVARPAAPNAAPDAASAAAPRQPPGQGLHQDLRQEEVPRGAAIALAGCFGAFPPAYGPLRYALTALEAGHALHNLVLLATALGLAPAVHLAFADQAMLARLGLPPDGSWTPLALVSLGAGLPELVGLRDAAPVSTDEPAAVQAEAVQAEAVQAVERATWLAGPDVAAWHDRAGGVAAAAVSARSGAGPEPLRPARPRQPLPPCPPPPPRSLGEVLYARNAGRATAGLCGRAVSIAAGVLHAAAAALRSLPGDAPFLPGAPGGSGVRVLFAAERIDGLDDGIYELSPDRGDIAPLRPGRCLEAVQAGFTYPPSSTNIRSMNLVWFLAVDYPAVLERRGARGLRLANLEMGWLAQGLCLAAAAEGLFARPVRSFREPVLDDLLGLGATEMIGYQILCGSNRFTDFLFDLRPPITGAHGGQHA